VNGLVECGDDQLMYERGSYVRRSPALSFKRYITRLIELARTFIAIGRPAAEESGHPPESSPNAVAELLNHAFNQCALYRITATGCRGPEAHPKIFL